MEVAIPLLILLFGSGTFLAVRQIRVRKIDKELNSAQYKIFSDGRITTTEAPPITPLELDNQMVKNIDRAEVATLTTIGVLELAFLAGKTGASITAKLGAEGIKDVMSNMFTPENISSLGTETLDVLTRLVATQSGAILIEHFDSLLANSVKGLVSVGLPDVLQAQILNQVVQVEALLNVISDANHVDALETMLDKLGEQEVLELDFMQKLFAETSEELAELLGSEVIETGLGIPFVSIGFGLFRFIKRGRNDVDFNRNLEFTAAEVGTKFGGGAIGAAIGTAVLPGVGSVIGGLAGTIMGGVVGNKIKGRHFDRESKVFQQKMADLQNALFAFDEPYSQLVEADLNYRLDLTKLGYELLEKDILLTLRHSLAEMIERYRAYDEGLTSRFKSQSIWSRLWPSKSDIALRQLYKSRQPVSQVEQKLGRAIGRIQEVENTGDAAQIGLYVYQNKALHPFIPEFDMMRRAQKIDRAKADWENPNLRAEVVRHRDLVITAEGETAQAYELVLNEAKQLDKKLQPYESFFVPA